jgi:hypothetical protein
MRTIINKAKGKTTGLGEKITETKEGNTKATKRNEANEDGVQIFERL